MIASQFKENLCVPGLEDIQAIQIWGQFWHDPVAQDGKFCFISAFCGLSFLYSLLSLLHSAQLATNLKQGPNIGS